MQKIFLGGITKLAFKQLKDYITTFQKFSYPKQGYQLCLDITHSNDFGTWSLWTKRPLGNLNPVVSEPKGFYTQAPNIQILKKKIWLLFEALKATEPLTGSTKITIRTDVLILYWTKLTPEEVMGIHMD